MKTRLLLVAAGVVAAAGLFTASLALADSVPATLHLTAKDNHKSFGVQLHTVIAITLRSCGSCGYHWGRGPTSGVKLLSHRYVQHNKPGQVGGEGKEIWRFEVVRSRGEGEIQLRYISPARKIVKHFVVGLRIH